MNMNELEIRLQDIDNRLKKLEKIERNRRVFGFKRLELDCHARCRIGL